MKSTMKSILDKVIAKGWDEDCDDCEDAIIQTCMTYEDMGRLIAELLERNAGSGDLDDRVVRFAAELVGEYISEYAPQPDRW